MLLAYNGLAIGAFAGHFANVGLLDYLLTFILGHGALELFAIWVAGAAGFLLGRSVVAPGSLSRADALVLSGRVAVRMVGATAVLLVVAGMIEGFVSAGGYSVRVRLAASAASLALLAAYLLNGVRFRAASSASGSPAPRSPGGWSPSPGSICASLSSSSWVSASRAESGLERSCRSLLSRSASDM